MIDPGTIAQIALATVAIAGLALTLHGLASGDGPTLADFFRIPIDPPWPRGVQEAEPPRWQLERLSRPRSMALRGTAMDEPRPAVDCSPRAPVPSTD